jgi:hypothetical protein
MGVTSEEGIGTTFSKWRAAQEAVWPAKSISSPTVEVDH